MASSYQYYQYLKYIKQQKVAPVFLNADNTTTSTGPISFSNNVIGLMYSNPLKLNNNALTLDTSTNYTFDGEMSLNNSSVKMANIPLVNGDTYTVTIDPTTKRLAYQTFSGTNISPNSITMTGTGQVQNVSFLSGKQNIPLVLESTGSSGTVVVKAVVGSTINSSMTLDNSGNIVFTGNTITIGNSNSVVNILGTKNVVTSSTVTDHVMILNKGGNIASSYGSGIAIESNGIKTAYILTDSVGGSYEVKVPNDPTIYTMMLKDPQGNMDMTGNLSINTNKFIVDSQLGNVTIAGTATVLNDINLNGALWCSSGGYFTGKMGVFGPTVLNSALDVSGITKLRNNVIVDGSLNVAGIVSVGGLKNTGNSSLNALSVEFNTHIGGALDVTGSTTITGKTSLNDVSLNGSFVTTNPSSIFKAAGNVCIGNNLDVSGTARIMGNTTMSSDLTLTSGTLRVGSNAIISGTTTIAGSANIATNINVTGTSILTGNVKVASTSSSAYTLFVNGEIYGSSTVYGTSFSNTSDTRIKTNIIDIDDSNALSILRKIQPKTYEYIDKKEKGNDTVIGFIAQEIQAILPKAVTIGNNSIPNFYTKCQVSLTDVSNVVLVSSPVDLSWSPLHDASGNAFIDAAGNACSDAYGNKGFKLKFYDQNNNYIRSKTTAILDKRHFLMNINEFINDSTGKVAAVSTLQNEYFLYGQEIDDFHYIDKSAIFTVVTAAVQDIDRKQQAQQEQIQLDEAKISALEKQNAYLESRLLQQQAQIAEQQAQISAILAKLSM